MRVYPGQPYPLGATWDGLGVNFSLFSEHATQVELCLFESKYSIKEYARILMPEYSDHVWHCYSPDIKPGQIYGYRVYGPYEPERGLRFNPNKIVIDPYAKAIVRSVQWDDSLYGYKTEESDLSFDERDSAPYAPLCAVIDNAFTWGDDKPPKTPWPKTIIYEAHLKNLTYKHPDIPEHLRGTYLGLASEPMINYLKDLGITAIELLPIHFHVDERFLSAKNLCNYWGYNTLGFFAPNNSYGLSNTGPIQHVTEFKMMVRALHAAGIEVILDVVYNHTAEGHEMGPTLSFRGIDNLSYYRLKQGNFRHYQDFTGCGNTLNMLHPRVLQLIMDSLRYWITEMHIDGFRFDLASALAREFHAVDKLGAFFDIIHQDPIISQVKLIAEPWDLGEGGYQVGNFPVLWAEWNGKYRDNTRRYWKGEDHQLNEFAMRIAGSSDLYSDQGKSPYSSINFITCHDGFALSDLVSYDKKHNLDNTEDNRDGENNNHSWNCGIEGKTENEDILKLRKKQRKNLIATLFLSLGVPMLSGGDEIGRSQRGNNNAYCQDNDLNWYNWEDLDQEFLDFTKQLIQIRKANPVLQRRKFFNNKAIRQIERKDIIWFSSGGEEMQAQDWATSYIKVIGMFLNGSVMHETDEKGLWIKGNSLLIITNSSDFNVDFKLPDLNLGQGWQLLLNTDAEQTAQSEKFKSNQIYISASRSLSLLQLQPD